MKAGSTRSSSAAFFFSAAFAAIVPPCAAFAQPDTRGPYAVETWNAGKVQLDGVEIPVTAHYPTGVAGPLPLAAVVHGASRYAWVMGELSNNLASRGFVALAPTIPCNFTGCDHEANARQVSALLEWGVAQSASAGSELFGLVDGTRRAVLGHSWGGLASFLAARDNPSIGLIVILDANDDKDVGKAAAPLLTQPNINVMAEKMGPCNSYNWKETIYPLTPTPHMRVVITGSAHCDVEDPTDGLCKFACGAGDPATAYLFRRYAVAWASCVFLGDAAMAGWLGGADLAADVAAGRINMVDSSPLDSLPCFGGAPDAGAAIDAGTTADAGAAGDAETGVPDVDFADTTVIEDTGPSGDGGPATEDAPDASPPHDSGGVPADAAGPRDAGAGPAFDAGGAAENGTSGCSCAALRP